MTALAADAQIPQRNNASITNYPVADNIVIYKNSLVCINGSGYAVAAADTSGYVCVGLAVSKVDNTTTGHVAGGKSLDVMSGRVFTLPTSGATQASVGVTQFVTDSATVGASATNNVVVGICCAYRSSTSIDVFIPLAPAGISGVSGLTATSAELNLLHSVTGGTVSASKAVVVGASKDVDTLKFDSSLILASAASVAFAATMALVVATPVITVAANHTTSATATINCAAVAPAGALLSLLITEGAGTGTVVTTFGTHFKSTGTLTTASSGLSSITFLGDGTNWNEIGRGATLA